MSRDYLRDVGHELQAVGIRGRLQSRILAEFEDHLECDPGAKLGSPSELARQFADELGTRRARRGAVATLGALAIAGILFAAAFLAATGAGTLNTAQSRPLTLLAAAVAMVASQVAFATGSLAALRLLWRRHDLVLTRAEATVIVRRTAIALGSGVAAMAGLALMAIEIRAGSSSWRTFVLIGASIGAAGLIAVSPTVLAAARVLPTAPGSPGDIFDDLGPFAPRPLRGRPWRLAFLVASALGLAIAVQGVIVSDPYDGILRGIAEALACFGGFAVLGRYIGLRSAAA